MFFILHKIDLKNSAKYYATQTGRLQMNSDSEMYNWLIRFFGLALLPLDQINLDFTELISTWLTDISEFLDYV